MILTAQGWVGVPAMPPQGGKPNLTLEEFSQALTYIGRGAGSNWAAPDASVLNAIEKELMMLVLDRMPSRYR